jgi:hypothetical protein
MQASVSHERQDLRDESTSMRAGDVQGHVAGIHELDWRRCPVCRVPVIKLRCRSWTSATASATGGPCLRAAPVLWVARPKMVAFVVRPEHDLTAQFGRCFGQLQPAAGRQARELRQAKSIGDWRRTSADTKTQSLRAWSIFPWPPAAFAQHRLR